jgi:hypothetical protein
MNIGAKTYLITYSVNEWTFASSVAGNVVEDWKGAVAEKR